MPPDPAQIHKWSATAPYWEKHRDAIRRMFAPVTQALIEDAGIGPGQAVLDIATGAGEPALTIARVVGPGGKICGVDPVPDMIAAARRQAPPNAEFEVAGADHMPFPDGTFDAVVSRFGAMFFPSPKDALREILRVLKPGGRMTLAVWHTVETNPFFYVMSRVLERYLQSPPPAPDALDAFRFAVPGKLRDILVEAGAAAPTERLLHFAIESSGSVEEHFKVRSEISESLRDKLAKLPPEQLAEIKRESIEALREYATSNGLSFPAEVLIVSGRKPTGMP